MKISRRSSAGWMIRNSWQKRTLSALIALMVLMIPLSAVAQDQASDFVRGKADGQRDAHGSPLWILAGAGCGICGAGAAFLIKPSPPASALVGQSSDYVLGYTEGYKNKARNQNVMWACTGWAAFVVIYAAAGGFNTTN